MGRLKTSLISQHTRSLTKNFWLHCCAILVLLITLATLAQAQSSDQSEKIVKIGFTGSVCSHRNYTIALNGTVATGIGSCTADTWVTTGKVYTPLKVNETYQLTAGTDSCSTHVAFDVPDEYTLEIDGIETTTIDKSGGTTKGSGDGTWNVVVRQKCSICSGGPAGESSGPTLGSIVWGIGLGDLSDGRTAESISLLEETLSNTSYTPAALIYSPPGRTTEVDVVRDTNGSLRQIKAPQTLADVITISASEYDIRFYRTADVGTKSNSLYTVSGQPFVIWKIKNPDPTTISRLQISKIQNGVTDTSEYTWDAVSNTWSLSKGGGASIQTKSVTYPTQTSRIETITTKDNTGQVISKVARTYHTYNWGEELLKEVIDPDGAALTTIYNYYEDSTETGRYTKVASITNPDGSWQKYDYDSSGNKTLELRPWKDLALAAATEANSRATRYAYSNFDGVTVSLYAKLISSIEEKVAGTTVRKTTFSRSSSPVNGEPTATEVQTVYSSASTSQTTSTTTYHSTASAFLANRTVAVAYPDGRKDTHSYEKGTYVANADPSLSQFTPDSNGIAQRDTIVHGSTNSPDGVAFKTTKETSVRNQFGHTVLQETYAYNGAGYERIAWTGMAYDDRGHVTQTRRHSGQVSNVVWNGDQKTADIDESGIETDYTYDSLGRVKTQTKKGVAASGTYPAQPDIVTTFTYDAEGRTLGQNITSGNLSPSKSSVYDRAGRLKNSTDEIGLVTAYTYANGGRKQTATLPGGATQITDKYIDGQTISVTGTAVVPQYFDYIVNTDGTQTTQAFVGSVGLSSPRWTKTTIDWLGRTIKAEKPGFSGTSVIQTSVYNSKGQLQTESVTAGTSKLVADKLYEYDDLGNQIRAGSDLDASGTLTALSTDRINETDVVYEKAGSDWFRVTSTRTYLVNGSDTPTIETQRERLNNFPVNGTENTVSDVTATDVAGNSTRTTSAVDRAAKKVTVTNTTPDSATNAVSITVNGLLQSSAPTTPQSATTYSYDALGRPVSVTDPRAGTATKVYSSTTGQLTSSSDAVQSTTYEYYPATQASAGRLKAQANSTGKKIYFNYNGRGDVVQTWGDTTYPIEYVYDSYGQKAELHTFSGGSNWGASAWPASTTGAASVTKWIYDGPTGLLAQKQDAVNKQVAYSYDAANRLSTRTWARTTGTGSPLTTTYSYDPGTGEMTGTTYSDATPAVTFVYDRGGRQSNVTDAGGARTRTFNARGDVQTEQVTGGILDGVNVTVGYDSFLRRNSLQSSRSGVALSNQSYTYDAASRLGTITGGAVTATYSYDPNSGLLSTTGFTGGTGIGRSYDAVGQLKAITTTPAAGTAVSYAYTTNNLHQRTKAVREDGSYWSYGYNDRGELISGKKSWADNTPVGGQQSEYSFDNIGNRTQAKTGGDALGKALRQSNYLTNALNQYVQRDVPGAVDVMGTADAAATVTVNSQATARKGDYFSQTQSVDNSRTPVYTSTNVVGAKNNAGANGEDAVAQQSGRVYVAQAAELYSYDADGNLTQDGRWNYTWDGENRLTSMEAIASVPIEAKRRLEFAYDYMGRRIQKNVSGWNAATNSYQLQSTTKFIYDGWNLIAEMDGSGVPTRSFVWGADGLQLINDSGNTYIAGYDGNANLTSLIKASTGTLAASYEYDPFGNTLKAVGEYAARNPFRFSTKYTDAETGQIYYGYRYYNPQTGRWISKDPIAEEGGFNLYAFIDNGPISAYDVLGMYSTAEVRRELVNTHGKIQRDYKSVESAR